MTMTRRDGVLGLAGLWAGLVGARAHAAPGTAVLEVLTDGTPLLDLILGGRPITAMLDTGASRTLVDPARAPASPGRRVTLESDVGGGKAVELGPLTLQILDRRVTLPAPLGLDLGPLREQTGRPIELVIGQDVLRSLALRLDPEAGAVSAAPSGASPVGDSWRRVPLRTGAGGRLTLEITVEGRSARAVFDLGSSSPLMADRAQVQAWGLGAGRPTSTAAVWSPSGVGISETLSVLSLEVAGLRLANVPCEAFPSWTDADVPFNVGAPVWMRFESVIDMGREQLWLRPIGARMTAPFQRDRSGLGLAFKGDALEVVHVGRASPAEATGFRVGERILRVDGARVDAAFMSSPAAEWRNGTAGRKVRLTMADGSVRELVLRTYY